MTNMMDGPISVSGISLTLDVGSGISASEAQLLLEKIEKETEVEIGFISINGKRVTIRIFGDFEKREKFLYRISNKGFVIQKATSLTER